MLESQFSDIQGDIREIKITLVELVNQGHQAKGRSEANSRLLQGLPPAMWTTFMAALGAAFLWAWEHMPWSKSGS